MPLWHDDWSVIDDGPDDERPCCIATVVQDGGGVNELRPPRLLTH